MRHFLPVYLTFLLTAGVAAADEPTRLFTDCTRSTVAGSLPAIAPGIKVTSSIATEEGVCYKVAGTQDGRAVAGAIFDQFHPVAVAHRLAVQEPPVPPPPAPQRTPAESPVAVRGQVLSFSGSDFHTGERFNLSSLKSKAILVHFWKSASDKAAQEDAEFLSYLKAQFGGQGLEVVGVTSERSSDRIRTFNDNAEAVWTLVQDRKGLAEKYGVAGPSEIFLLDSHGAVVSAGPRSAELERLVSKQLRIR